MTAGIVGNDAIILCESLHDGIKSASVVEKAVHENDRRRLWVTPLMNSKCDAQRCQHMAALGRGVGGG